MNVLYFFYYLDTVCSHFLCIVIAVRAFHILKSSPPHFFVKEEVAFPATSSVLRSSQDKRATSSFFTKNSIAYKTEKMMELLPNITFHKSPMVS